jgi:hypothetical protein
MADGFPDRIFFELYTSSPSPVCPRIRDWWTLPHEFVNFWIVIMATKGVFPPPNLVEHCSAYLSELLRQTSWSV